MNYDTLPFQKLTLEDLARHIDNNGQIHTVLNACGFLLCQKGWAKVSLGENTYTLQKGDMYIYAPSTFINIIEWSDDLQGLAFKSTLDYILPFLERSSSQKTIVNIRTRPCITLTQEQQDNIEELTHLIDRKTSYLESLEEGSVARPFVLRELECFAEAFISELLLYYITSQSSTPESSNHKDKVVQTFLISLFQHYKRQREVKFYAEEQCLTPRYFSTIVKELTGKSALLWISEMVISNSCQLLAYTNMTIKEIALELNFPTQSFFGKYFKQYMHCSPLQYRHQHKMIPVNEQNPTSATIPAQG